MELHKEYLPARKDFWVNKPTWTIEQFVFLLHGFDPVEFGKKLGVGPQEAMTIQGELVYLRDRLHHFCIET